MAPHPTPAAPLPEGPLALLFRLADDILCISNLDGYFVEINPAAVATLGHTESVLLGSPFMDLVHPDDVQATMDAMTLLSEPGGTLRGFVNRFRHASGEWRRLEWTAHQQGGLIYSSARDVTQRVADAADERLQAAIAATMSEAAYALRSDGVIVYADRRFEEMFGYSPGEMIGQHASILNAPSNVSPEELAAEILALITAQGFWQGEVENIRKCGEHFWCRANVSVHDHPVHGRLIVAVHTDITEARFAAAERERLDAELQQDQKMKSLGVLAGGIAHDFNNLLTVILGNAELGLAESSAEARTRQNLDRIRQAATEAAGLADQMLAYSGRAHATTRRVDLNELVVEMSPLLAASSPKGSSPTVRPSDRPLWVDADPAQLRQVVMNLVTNAMEAAQESAGTVEIGTSLVDATAEDLAGGVVRDVQPGRFAVLEVRDEGVGMSPEAWSRLFEPFYSTKFTGRGLGLSVVLGIVQSHGGTLLVSSREGRGTTFEVLLPALPASAQRVEPAGSPAVPPSVWPLRGHEETAEILVVDDEASVREVTVQTLVSAGYPATGAAGGFEALERVQDPSVTIRAVLLDRTMPGMSGEEVCEHLRTLRPDLPILMYSGYGSDELDLSGAVGPDGFLAKPYTRDGLVAAIVELLDR